jgi:hypothetical protein
MKFNLPAYATNYFSTKVWVKCPKCNEKALVTSKPSKYVIPLNNDAKICCTSCSFKSKSATNWNGYCQGSINLPCGYCGSRLNFVSKPTKELYRNKSLKCEACHKEKEYEMFWAPYKGNLPSDPFFGYDLWLQTNVKGNVLWGYNKEHLEYIKFYIEASLREDNSRHKYSLIANLPKWMTIAKNRDNIVKKIDKLIGLV